MQDLNEKKIKDFTTEDYFKFINLKKIEIEKYHKNLMVIYNIYRHCCYYDRNTKTYICNKNELVNLLNNNKLIATKIFKEMFGEHFFDMDEKTLKEFKEKGMFTKDSLGIIFDDVIGALYGVVIKMPTNFDELIDMISKVIMLTDNSLIPNDKKEPYIHLFTTIENLLAERFKGMHQTLYCQKYVMEAFDELYKKYNKKEKIDALEEDLVIVLNKVIQERVDEENKVSFEDISFGDLSMQFIDRYNEELKQKQMNKQIMKYFKKLKKKSLDNLSWSDFPVLDKETYILLRNEIENYINIKNDDKKDLSYLLPLLDMYYYQDLSGNEKSKNR